MSTRTYVFCDFCGKSELEVQALVKGPKADVCDECAAWVISCLPPITDAQIDALAEGMPGGIEGFLKGWGWRQFARAVLELRCPTPEKEP